MGIGPYPSGRASYLEGAAEILTPDQEAAGHEHRRQAGRYQDPASTCGIGLGLAQALAAAGQSGQLNNVDTARLRARERSMGGNNAGCFESPAHCAYTRASSM